ncbi:G-protein coupled receptor Mth-like 1-like 2 [Homarus americanus]|uniref:G-protein coupled receptor Mth-like 1-like 2 n=1 Tax=Homarus americanus TaxID=6706 RepID=A0A8J5MM74_HOMAM|nr:G-protein coupled receptor Mth-like 1-like 2 [Homarus americanus]
MVVGGVWGESVAHLLLLLLLGGTLGGPQDGGGDKSPLEDEYPGLAENYPLEHMDYPNVYDEVVDFNDPRNYYSSNFTPHLANSTVYKCHCEGDAVWDGSTCHPFQTIVAVINPSTGERVVANTSEFGSVQVGSVTCPPGLQVVLLDSNSVEHQANPFSLLESGDLYWHWEVFSHYCFDHTFEPNGEPRSWQALVCLAPPSVPRCCPPAHALRENKCVPQHHSTFAPPVLLEGQAVEWEVVKGEVVNVTCDSNSHTSHRLVDSQKVSLVYTPKGALLHWTPPFTLPEERNDYCIGVEADEEGVAPRYTAKLCYEDRLATHHETCINRTCVRKCCQEHFFVGTLCEPVKHPSEVWSPVFHDPNTLEPDAPAPADLTIVHGYPICTAFFRLDSHLIEEDKFYLLENGALYVPIFSRKFPAHEYCLEKFLFETGEIHTLPLVCFQDDPAKLSTACRVIQNYVYPVLLLFSCVFLAITLLIYVSVPELHAKVHGKCLVAHVSALLMAYVTSVTHFSFLAAFFWLNVMCFDIWWTLKSMRPVAETGELSRFRFKMYSVYSWGCPIIISLVAIIVQALPEDFNVIRPDFGSKKCWFDNDKSLWAYFFGFVLVLVVANIIFFAQVAYILIMAQNDPILQRTRQQNRERVITDIVNTLQGFSIFLIFICKRNMLRRVRNNWEPYLRRMKEFFGSSRQSKSIVGKSHPESSSFSSSVNRPSQSAASQRTVQSQISLDPSSASRKLSSSSLVSTTGVQVHSPNSISMDTINEGNHHEDDQNIELGGPTGKDIGSAINGNMGSERETSLTNSNNVVNQDTSMKTLNSISGQTDSVQSLDSHMNALNSNNGQIGNIQPLDNNNEASPTPTKKFAPLRTSDESSPTRQGDHTESTPLRNVQSEVSLEDVEDDTPQIDSDITLPQREFVNNLVKTTESDHVRSQEENEPVTVDNEGVLVLHNRAFTTEDEDDQPVDV